MGGTGQSMLVYAPAVLLCTVATGQRVLMETCSLDPWKGGGFGMFSAISAQSLRAMTVTLVTADGQEKRFPPRAVASRIPLDGRMRWERRELVTMPRESAARRLAAELAAAEWVAARMPPDDAGEPPESDKERARNPNSDDTEIAESPDPEAMPEFYRIRGDQPDEAITRPLALRAVRIEIWQYVLDRPSGELKLTNLLSVTEPVP